MKALIAEGGCEERDDIVQAFKVCLSDCELTITDSGRRCLDMVKDERPDVVILGLNLADMSGFDVIEKIHGCSEVPVIVVSYISDGHEVVRAFDLGADGYIVRPIRQLEFMARVGAVLRRVSVYQNIMGGG